jgi:hypothetical protein
MSVSIKESLEALEAVKVLLQDLKKVLADGKISIGDVGVIFDLLKQFPVLNAGVQGADQILPELKDVDSGEAEQLMAKALEIAAIFKA